MKVNRKAFERTTMKIDRGQGPLTVQDLQDIFGGDAIQALLSKGAAPAHCRKCGAALPERKPITLAGGYTAELCEACHNGWLEVAQADARSVTWLRENRRLQQLTQAGKSIAEVDDLKLMRAAQAMFRFARDYVQERPKVTKGS